MPKTFKYSPAPSIDEVELGLRRATLKAQKGEVDAAVESLSKLLERFPTRWDILAALSRILIEARRFADAAGVLTVLKVHLPHNVEVLRMSGLVHLTTRFYAEAEIELLEVVKLKPDDVESYVALAQLYETGGRDDEAAEFIDGALRNSPPSLELSCHAAALMEYAGRDAAARKLLSELPLEIASAPEARLLRAMIMPMIVTGVDQILERRADLAETLRAVREEGRPLRRPEKDLRITNFQIGYQGMEDRDLIEQTALTLLDLAPQLGYVAPVLERNPCSNRRLKVGFVSAHMRVHSVGRVLNRFLKEFDRDRFEVLLFELPGKFDGGQEIARGYADRTTVVPGDLNEAREAIESEEPDILCFPDFVLDSFTDYLAYSRLAPVQFSTWGHPGTSGRPSIDYWVSCEDWEPEGNERLYTERLVRLSAPPMIATRLDVPPNVFSRESLGLPEGRLYGCPQSLYKLHPEYDSYLGEVLRADPEGKVVLVGGIQQKWIETFKTRFARTYGDVVDRLVFLPHLSTNRYLSLLSHCAVSLDPIHFGGANTSMEAFTMGLPVVTQPGGQLRNRQTLSFYRMMDFTELVVDSEQAYVETALRVARDPDYRAYASKQVLERCHVLFDTVAVTRELEAFMERAARETIGG
jgi:protein O-GlcNAc transferase